MTASFVLLILSLVGAFAFLFYRNQIRGVNKVNGVVPTPTFRAFQRNYLLVYFLAVLADWIQGPYVYALYQSYGYTKSAIAWFFVVGFSSSLIFGTFVGSLGDKYGRRRMAVLYGVLYSGSCACKMINSVPVLVLGRLLSGVSTSLLFSAFESWMVHQHHKNGFPEANLSQTFSLSTLINGLSAVLAGVLASFVADPWGLAMGFRAPFAVAAVILVCLSVVVQRSWEENYGEKGSSLSAVFSNALEDARSDPHVWLICLAQSLFEGSMYTFVFIWTPALLGEGSACAIPPFGWIFAAYMVAIMVGSQLFSSLIAGWGPELLAQLAFGSGAIALLSATVALSARGDVSKSCDGAGQGTATFAVLTAFMAFEACCGIYFPSMGTLKSKYLPERSRSALMNLARVGLNVALVTILLEVHKLSNGSVTFLCFLALSGALATQVYFSKLPVRASASVAVLPSVTSSVQPAADALAMAKSQDGASAAVGNAADEVVAEEDKKKDDDAK